MSSKTDLQRKLSELGYQVGPYASKDTLTNIIRLHTTALENKGVDVAHLSDLVLRKSLTENGLTVGPVTNHTRAIYQRKLLEVLTNETSEGQEDEFETDIPTSITPPRATRNSINRNGDDSITSSPGRLFTKELQEPRIPLTRVDIEDRNTNNVPSLYPNLSSTKPKAADTITNSYASQRSSTKPEPRNSNVSYGLRNPYDFQNDEPVVIRHEHKATPFRTSNISSDETYSTNTNRSTKQSDVLSSSTSTSTSTRNAFSSGNDINEIRARIFGNTNEQKNIQPNKDVTPKKPTSFDNESNFKKPVNNEKLEVAAKSNGTFLYGGITIGVALVVFVLYLLLGN